MKEEEAEESRRMKKEKPPASTNATTEGADTHTNYDTVAEPDIEASQIPNPVPSLSSYKMILLDKCEPLIHAQLNEVPSQTVSKHGA